MNRTSNNLRGCENTADFFSIAVMVVICLNAYRMNECRKRVKLCSLIVGQLKINAWLTELGYSQCS